MDQRASNAPIIEATTKLQKNKAGRQAEGAAAEEAKWQSKPTLKTAVMEKGAFFEKGKGRRKSTRVETHTHTLDSKFIKFNKLLQIMNLRNISMCVCYYTPHITSTHPSDSV